MNTEILNQYIELIDKGYCEDCNELNCLGNFPQKDIAKNIKVILEENQKLKKQLEKYIRAEFKAKDELEKQRKEYQDVYKDVRIEIKGYKNQQKEFIEYLENEKNRLAKECSYTYEGSLGKLLYVNEDIFNEVNRILLKYKEIIGGDNK